MFSFIFKKNLPLIWRNKKLWILGIFTSFLGATEETELLLNILIPNRKNVFEFIRQLYDTKLFTSQGLNEAWKLITQEPMASAIPLLILITTLFLVLLLMFLSLVSQGAIISASSKVRQKPLEKITRYLGEGEKKFWPILWINIISKIIIGLIFFAISYTFVKNIYLSLILFLIFIIGVGILYILMKLAICIVVIEKKNLLSALRLAYISFYENWKDTMRLLIALLVFTIFGILLSIASLFILYVPFFFIIEASLVLSFTALSTFMFVSFLFCATIILTFFFGFLSAVSWISWTHLYQNLSAQNKREN